MRNAHGIRPTARGGTRPTGVKDLLRQGDCVQFTDGRESLAGRVLDVRSNAVLLEYSDGRFHLARQVAFSSIQRILSSSVCTV